MFSVVGNCWSLLTLIGTLPPKHAFRFSLNLSRKLIESSLLSAMVSWCYGVVVLRCCGVVVLDRALCKTINN